MAPQRVVAVRRASGLLRVVAELRPLLVPVDRLHREGKVYGDAQWKDRNVLAQMSERKTEEEIEISDHRKVEVDGNNGQFVGEYFRTSCPSYFKRDYYHLMF